MTPHSGPPSVVASRLQSQLLNNGDSRDPGAVSRWFGALQAQDYRACLWAIGARSPGSTVGDVEAAFGQREIVRSWVLRGTIHVVAAAELRWMLDLIAPRLLQGAAVRLLRQGLDDESLALSARVVERCLADGAQLTRSELYRQWDRSGLPTTENRGYHMLWWNALHQRICNGPHREAQPTFVLLDDWLPLQPRLSRDEALSRLLLLYLQGHSPASLRDFAWWAGLTISDARRALAVAGAQVIGTADETETWLSLADQPSAPPVGADVLLLAAFDEYVLGYTQREWVLNAAHAAAVYLQFNGYFQPVMVLQGRVAGIWRTSRPRDKPEQVEVTAFQPLDDNERAHLTETAARYSAFVGHPVEVVVTVAAPA